MKEAIEKAIEGGYDFSGKLKNVGLGDGVWEIKEPDEVVVRRKEVNRSNLCRFSNRIK